MPETHFLLQTDSTNRVAFEWAESGAQHGDAIFAEMQSNGRGRLGRGWYSPACKGMYCSIIVKPSLDIQKYPQITIVAGLAVSNALNRVCKCASLVKWPNDIFIGGKKIGGILTESSLNAANGPFAIVGIGLNINNDHSDFPLEIEKTATSVFLETGKVHDIQEIFEGVREELLHEIKIFEMDDFDGILQRWKKKDALKGKVVRWVTPTGTVVCGRSAGPNSEGRLIVQDEEGQCHEVISGDVSIAGTLK
jgi:BirA family biotin operon repressor/biotin-[acetyl-CoA-carboxylase] ligase